MADYFIVHAWGKTSKSTGENQPMEHRKNQIIDFDSCSSQRKQNLQWSPANLGGAWETTWAFQWTPQKGHNLEEKNSCPICPICPKAKGKTKTDLT